MLPTKFGFIGQTISVEKNIKKSANQKQESHVAAIYELNYRYMPLKPLSQMN
jgi:hypothetical protein